MSKLSLDELRAIRAREEKNVDGSRGARFYEQRDTQTHNRRRQKAREIP